MLRTGDICSGRDQALTAGFLEAVPKGMLSPHHHLQLAGLLPAAAALPLSLQQDDQQGLSEV
jgi:hypothetical protein